MPPSSLLIDLNPSPAMSPQIAMNTKSEITNAGAVDRSSKALLVISNVRTPLHETR